jgi:type II secretory pathway pseudopilin PulG
MLEGLLPLFFPSPQGSIDAQERAEMAVRLTKIGLALNAYRTEQGRYPKELDALVPRYIDSIPGDLFTGRASEYVLIASGFRITSPGPNGSMDGADPAGWLDQGEGHDLVVQIPSRPAEPDRGP